MPKIAAVLDSLGFVRVGGLLDEGKETTLDELTRRFPSYFFSTIPASDIRTKPAEPPRNERKGLLDGTGKIRRDLFVPALNKIPGFRCYSPEGAFYAWVNIEETGLPAEEVQTILLEEAGVAAIAGAAFGAEGKNYLRFSLVSARSLLEDTLDRIQRVSVKWRGVPA